MSTARATTAPLQHADQFFIGGEWVKPSSDTTFDVIDSGTEEVYYTIAGGAPDDMARAVAAARQAFDDGPWTRLTHAQRAEYITALGAAVAERGDALSQLWPRESGVLYSTSQYSGRIALGALAGYGALAETFPFEEECAPTGGGNFGLLVREPVGVVGAIIPWNAPVALICHKIGPALLAGCTVVLKSAPEAPGAGNIFAEAAAQIGLPAGVFNVVTADREVSELLVTNPDVDKITFT
jgi:aldehyde dehydrogenase (NAD+)